MNDNLLSNIKTVEDREKLEAEFKLLNDALFKDSGAGIDKCLKFEIRAWVAEIIRSEIPAEIDKAQKYIKKNLQELAAIETLELTLAYEPTQDVLARLSAKAKELAGKQILLSVSYNPKILGGAIITYQGEYRDLSLRNAFEAEYKEKEKEVLEIVYSK